MVRLVGFVDTRFLYTHATFLSEPECDYLCELIHTIEPHILNNTPSADNSYYSGLTSRHGQYNFFQICKDDLSIDIGTRLRDLIYTEFGEQPIWIKSWCNSLHHLEEIKPHIHGNDPQTDPIPFLTGNIFLSQPDPQFYTNYATYGRIMNQRGDLSLISSYLEHSVDPNPYMHKPRYSCAFDIYFTEDPSEVHDTTHLTPYV